MGEALLKMIGNLNQKNAIGNFQDKNRKYTTISVWRRCVSSDTHSKVTCVE